MTALAHDSVDRGDTTSVTLDRLDDLLDGLELSPEPAVALTSLARACVPDFSDECILELVEDGGPAHRVVLPDPADDLPVRGNRSGGRGRVRIGFDGAAHGAETYRGTVECVWHRRDDIVTDAIVLRILVGRAVALIAEARLAEQARRAETAAANLRVALASSRTIGNAVGILMVAYKVNDKAAFEMLRELSQRTNRKVIDMATDVVETGCLDHTAPNRT